MSQKSDSLIKQTASTEQKSVRYFLANDCQRNKQNNETRQQQQTEEMRLLRPRKSARRIVTFCIHPWKHFWQYGPRRKQTKLKRKGDRLLPWETREKCLFVKRRQQMGKALDYLDVGSSSAFFFFFFLFFFFFFFLYSHTISMTATRRTLVNCFISLYISVLVQNHCFFVRCITKVQLTQN